MGLWRWLTGLFRQEPKLMDELPEVLGHVTDEHGKRQPLRRGWIKHESLSPEQLQRIGRLRDVLIDAYPMTLDGWVDGFMRDANPEGEIQIIEACAVVYQEIANQTQLSADDKKRLYAVLCGISAGASGTQLAAAVPSGKGLPGVESLISMYQEARQEGKRP